MYVHTPAHTHMYTDPAPALSSAQSRPMVTGRRGESELQPREAEAEAEAQAQAQAQARSGPDGFPVAVPLDPEPRPRPLLAAPGAAAARPGERECGRPGARPEPQAGV